MPPHAVGKEGRAVGSSFGRRKKWVQELPPSSARESFLKVGRGIKASLVLLSKGSIYTQTAAKSGRGKRWTETPKGPLHLSG